MATVSDGEAWWPLRALIDGPALDERVSFVREFLGQMSGTQVEKRVAASTMSLGLFARLVSPYLGATVLDLHVPAPDLDHVFWQPIAGGPWPLALTGAVEAADLGRLVTEVVVPLADVIADRYSLSSQILRGNAASAVFGAVTMISGTRPDLHQQARNVGAGLLTGVLAGTGRFDGGFIRDSCCLYYRIPGGGYCGDCVLADR